MKILFLSYWYPTKDRPLFGAFIKQHAGAIKEAGCNIVVVSMRIGKGDKLYSMEREIYNDENGIETNDIKISSFFHKIIYLVPFFSYFILMKFINKQILPKFKPDIIHSNVIYPCGVVGHLLSKRLNFKHVITEHWSMVDKFMKENIFSSIGSKAYNQSAAITVVSNYLKKSLSKHITIPEKIHIVPNVIRTNLFTFKPKEYNEVITFTAIAAWEPPKAPELLIKALSQLQQEKSIKFYLNIVGEGSQIEFLKKQSFDIKINYTGKIDWSEVAQILHRTDYVLHASHMETFSIVIAESLCTGTPVIASNVGATNELIDDKNGLLCENTVEDWVQAIAKALTIKYNHAEISRNIINKYSKKAISEKFRLLYEQILFNN